MIKKLILTEDHLKLLPFILFDEVSDIDVVITKSHLFNLGNHLLEDIATILGRLDEAIPYTNEDAEGRAFSDEFEAYMLSLYEYIKDNLYDIEILIHQFIVKGGLSEGIYKCKDNDMIWTKETL